jgi:TonB-linked SusC/RagA family outer membrane protein
LSAFFAGIYIFYFIFNMFLTKTILHMRKFKNLMVGILLLTVAGVNAQTKQVTGKVTDPTGAPIPGATIKVRGAKTGTSAGSDGSFKLAAPENAVLIITGIGYESKELKTGSTTNFSIQLNQDSKALSEVVITGVGVATSKKHLGIDVEAVTASQLPATPTASIDQALIGKIPGAQISSISGNPGDPVNILLRGINSIQGGTMPLIMLDGIQVRTTDINSLDLSNIERVEVVQGAASSALYGAQGANGVIQLFSKKGKRGATVINFSTSYAANSYINSGHVNKSALHPYLTDANNNILDANGNPDTLNAAGVIPYVAYTYGGPNRSGIYNPLNINDKPYDANLKWYDHFKQVFQTGYTLNNSINFSGASDKTDYAFGVSNNHTVSPVMKNGYVDRTNLTANIGAELFKGFKIRSITQLVYTKNTLVPGLGGPNGPGYGYGNNPGATGGIFSWLNTPAFYSLNAKLADGTYPAKQVSGNYLGANAFNPFYTQEYASGIDNRIDIIQDFAADYKINKFISLDAKYGINFRTENDKTTYLNQSQNLNSIFFGGGSYSGGYAAPDNTGEIDNFQYTNTFQEFTSNAYIHTDWQKDFHSKLPITTTTQVGWDYRKTKYREYDTYGLGLPLAPPINIGSTSAHSVIEDYIEPFITFGYLVNQTIDYGDYGGISGGFRSDYSSAFGQGSKPFTFPHANAYFVPSSFRFWEDGIGNTLSYFKIRAAYGQAGIQPGAFQRYPVINQGTINQDFVYSIPGTSNNPNLGVEVSTAKEIGADFTIAANKKGSWFTQINFSGTYWKNKSDHVIYTVPVAPSLGFTGLLTNAITLHSSGVQFQVNIPVYKSKDFSWDFTANYGHQISKLDKIIGTDEILLTSGTGYAQALKPGTKIGQENGYKAYTSLSQVDPNGGGSTFEKEGGFEVVQGRVVDTASKLIQFGQTATTIGDGNPKFTASFINGFNYKGIITLSFQFDWIYGSHLYNATKEWMYRDGIHNDFDKKVTINGQTAAWTAYHASAYYSGTSGNGNDAVRDYFYESSSFLRLRNISLGFDIAKFVKLPYIRKCQLVFTGRNILTKTKYTGMDPEISSGSPNSAWDRTTDNSTIPNTKSYQVGLNLGF